MGSDDKADVLHPYLTDNIAMQNRHGPESSHPLPSAALRGSAGYLYIYPVHLTKASFQPVKNVFPSRLENIISHKVTRPQRGRIITPATK